MGLLEAPLPDVAALYTNDFVDQAQP